MPVSYHGSFFFFFCGPFAGISPCLVNPFCLRYSYSGAIEVWIKLILSIILTDPLAASSAWLICPISMWLPSSLTVPAKSHLAFLSPTTFLFFFHFLSSSLYHHHHHHLSSFFLFLSSSVPFSPVSLLSLSVFPPHHERSITSSRSRQALPANPPWGWASPQEGSLWREGHLDLRHCSCLLRHVWAASLWYHLVWRVWSSLLA